MPDGDVMKASIEGKFDGEPVTIDLGFISASGAATFQEEADGLSSEIIAALGLSAPSGSYMSPLSAQYQLQNLRIQDLNPGVSAGLVYGLGVAGENVVDDAMAPSLALCVTWRTGLKGQANRGRSYLTGFAEDSGNAGFWVPEIQAWAQSAFAQPLMDAFGPASTTGWVLAVVHSMSGGVRLVPPTATPIVSYTIHNESRSLRRRSIGVRISRRRTGP